MFAKVFHQIFNSSIAEHPQTRFTFTDLLILADGRGRVDMTHDAIARRTNRPLEIIRETIAELEGPDPNSRDPKENGARIVRLDEHRDWGWQIVNFWKYRTIGSTDERKDYKRKWIADKRLADPNYGRGSHGSHGRQLVDKEQSPADPNSGCSEQLVDTSFPRDVDLVDSGGQSRHKQKQKQIKSTEETNVSSVVTTQLRWSVTTSWEGLTKELEAEFSAAYPACNIKRQFLCMEQWLKANAQKAHKSNWRRFAINWLKRAQDRGGDLGSVRGATPQSKSKDVSKRSL